MHVGHVGGTSERGGEAGAERRGEQELEELPGLVGHLELGAHGLDVVVELGGGDGDVLGASPPADHGLLDEIAGALSVGERAVVALEGAHHRPRDAGVDPPDETRIEGPVRDAVGADAVHPGVHAPDPVDQSLGRGRVPEGGDDHVAVGRAGPPERLLPIGGLVVHPRHHRGMEDLHDDGRQAAEEGGGHVRVHLPRDAARADQARVPRRRPEDLDLVVRSGHGRVLLDQAAAKQAPRKGPRDRRRVHMVRFTT